MLDAIVSWPTFIVALVVFGFAPGAVLRIISLAFWPDDPRREELRAELHAVPRLERPFWVLEQLEVALFEGVFERLHWAATGRIIHRWHLGSGVERNREHPDSFWVPTDETKRLIIPGMSVKLMFEMKDEWCERMWVDVTAVDGDRLVQHPLGDTSSRTGRRGEVRARARHRHRRAGPTCSRLSIAPSVRA